MCWASTGYSAHGVQIFGCYYTSLFEQEILSTLAPQKQLLRDAGSAKLPKLSIDSSRTSLRIK